MPLTLKVALLPRLPPPSLQELQVQRLHLAHRLLLRQAVHRLLPNPVPLQRQLPAVHLALATEAV